MGKEWHITEGIHCRRINTMSSSGTSKMEVDPDRTLMNLRKLVLLLKVRIQSPLEVIQQTQEHYGHREQCLITIIQ